MLVKTEDTDFCRDDSSNALINTNAYAFKLYKQQRDSSLNASKNEEKIKSLENEIEELKQMVKILVEKQNG